MERMINFEEIVKLAKEYDIEVSKKGFDAIYLKSANNIWYFYLRDLPENINDRKKIYLYHKSHDNTKEHYHSQRAYFCLWHMMDSIKSHDLHMFKERRRTRRQIVLEQISQEINNKNKKKVNKLHKKPKYKSPHIDFKKLNQAVAQVN
jgi:hypothetical protein